MLFYFTLKAPFVLKVFNFLVMYQKGLIRKIEVNFKFYDVAAWLANNYNTHIAQYFQSMFYIRISIKKKQAYDFSERTRGFELVTRKFEFVTRMSELVIRGFELALLNFNSCFYTINSCF